MTELVPSHSDGPVIPVRPHTVSGGPTQRRGGGASLKELWEGKELLWNLTLRELRSKYKRSALGWAWSMVNPLSSIGIYAVVFGMLLIVSAPPGNPSGLRNFTMYLTCALLPWNFLATSISASTGSLVGNSNLLKKVYFPREYIVASTVLSWVVSFLIELAVLCVGFLFFGHVVFQWIPLVLFIVAVQTVLVMGYSLALAALNVYFRDMQHLISIALQVWFYLTPVVYPIANENHIYVPVHRDVFGVSVPLRRIYELNPMVHVVTAYRNALYDGRFPGAASMAYLVGSSFVVLAIGWTIFRRLEPRMVEEL